MPNERHLMTSETFAGLGGGKLAYVKPMLSENVKDLFPNVPAMAPGVSLWALLAADGTPIMLSDSREAVVMNAHENDLETVSLH
jgi:hypothetical protein